jgi:hypothetical protein
MKKVLFFIAAGLLTMSSSAQQVNLFGKVMDTSGTALEGVVVSLAAHQNMADTTGKDGVFSIVSQGIGTILKSVSAVESFTKCEGNTITFAVTEPTNVSIAVYNTLGRQLSQPLNKIVEAGTFRIPVTADFGRQILFVRVRRGSEVKVFRMQNLNKQQTNVTGPNGALAQSSLFKAKAAAVDTLVFSRRGLLTQGFPISSYTSTDSIRIIMQPVSTPNPNIFGVLINQSEGQQLSTNQKIDLLKNQFKVPYTRHQQVLTNFNGSIATYDSYISNGLKVLLNVTSKATNLQQACHH